MRNVRQRHAATVPAQRAASPRAANRWSAALHAVPLRTGSWIYATYDGCTAFAAPCWACLRCVLRCTSRSITHDIRSAATNALRASGPWRSASSPGKRPDACPDHAPGAITRVPNAPVSHAANAATPTSTWRSIRTIIRPHAHRIPSNILFSARLRNYSAWYCSHASSLGWIPQRNTDPQDRRHRKGASHTDPRKRNLDGRAR